MLFPEPTYQGPENVTYLRGAQGLQEELYRDTRIVWLVAFYTAWNPACVNFAPIFSELSAEYVAFYLLFKVINHSLNIMLCKNVCRYALENLRFGKVDIGRYPDAGVKYHISDASTSKQLPTLILFKEGKEVERRPYADHKGKLVKFLFSLVSNTVLNNFKLYNMYYRKIVF